MTKILSQTAQISLLKRLRRMCPFAVWSGQYGYTCGGMKNGVRSSSGMGGADKGGSPLPFELYCIDLRKAAFRNGYDITLSTHKLNAYG